MRRPAGAGGARAYGAWPSLRLSAPPPPSHHDLPPQRRPTGAALLAVLVAVSAPAPASLVDVHPSPRKEVP